MIVIKDLIIEMKDIKIDTIGALDHQCDVHIDKCSDCKVYVGGLPERASRGELEEIFGRFGPLRNVWVARRPWGFAFVEFEDARDAIDAVRQLDGSRMCGVRARVELSHGQRRNRGPRGYDDERRGGDRRSRTPPRRSRSGSYRRSRSPSRKRYRRSRNNLLIF
ncbi:splicing factor, arginine/serine-rich 3 [Trichinella spiralis]|uniref:splicing factor, arginine/serine-rich 3 n=1 Tax=Trichinella spiralis TaxID=6334 RepID=UPI0001EFC69A|nr:splicing factor, arginine/serine-rich 3 [Trichinella spiralis]